MHAQQLLQGEEVGKGLVLDLGVHVLLLDLPGYDGLFMAFYSLFKA